MTLGSRVAVFDGQGRVLLIRPTYAGSWILPGGGVERGETIIEAAVRELREEAGIIPAEAPVLHGFHSNEKSFRGDHLASFVVRVFSQAEWSPNSEVAEARFFDVSNLPKDINQGSARRIAEIVAGLTPDPRW
jgi:ADP-ribose pyrophosphatase YjhB (NUDIX family)